MPFIWRRRPETALGELTEAYVAAIRRGVLALAERYTGEIESWMKDNAPWTDRTGEARRTLHSEVLEIADQAVVIILGHGQDYGVFLELKFGGRDSVIFPALDYFLPRIWADVQAMLRGI